MRMFAASFVSNRDTINWLFTVLHNSAHSKNVIDNESQMKFRKK